MRACCAGIAALAFGLLIFALLPSGLGLLNDDFGYLRSAVETLQRRRPWTDDWLEPWAASLSALAALAYQATGSFQLAIHGSLAALAALTFWGTTRLLLARGSSQTAALLGSFLVLTFPTVLWKTVEFNGMAIYLPCLVLALCAAERRRWGQFLLWWALALATRQSAIIWLAMPLLSLAQSWVTRGREPGGQTKEAGCRAGWAGNFHVAAFRDE